MDRKRLLISTALLLTVSLAVSATASKEPASDEPEKVTLFNVGSTDEFPEDQTVIDWVVEHVREEYGLNFTLDIPRAPSDTAEYYQVLALRLAAGDVDAWAAVLQSDQLGYMASLLANLDEPLAEYGQNAMEQIPERYWGAAKDSEGHFRFMPTPSDRIADKVVWVRADLYEELMGEALPQVVSLAELEAFMRAVHAAYPDIDPFGRTATTQSFFDRAFLGLGFPAELMGSDGRPVMYAGENHDNVRYPQLDSYVERLGTINRWYEAGLIPSEFLTWARQQAIDATTQGKVAAAVSSWWRNSMFETARQNGVDLRMVALVDENGTGMYRDMSVGQQRSIQVLQRSADKAKYIVALFDWAISSLENANTLSMGIPGVHWRFSEDGTQILPPEGYDSFNDFQAQEIYSGVLHSFTARSIWSGDVSAMRFEGEDTSWEFAFSEEIPRSAPPDGMIPYTGFTDVVMERGIRFSDVDWGTLLDEVEAAAMLGEVTPEEAQATLLDYLENNDWDKWWAARMEMYDAATR